MSRLAPGIVPLDKGLNLQTPKIAAPEGSLFDMLNYEQVDFQGQKRIDGYYRYDGQRGADLDDFYRFDQSDDTWDWGEGLTVVDLEGNIIGIEVGHDDIGEWSDVAVIDYNRIPETAVLGRDAVTDPEEHYELLLNYNNELRHIVGQLPGPVAALHWFRDRLYAVASLMYLTLTAEGEWAPEVGMLLTTNGDTYHPVLAVLDGNMVLLGGGNQTDWEVGAAVYEDWDGFPVATVAELQFSPVASFFEARSELQTLEEDGTLDAVGWRFIHQGWTVPFEAGTSLYGSLPSLNQNIQGVGIQGPTSITGNSGRPLTLTQGIDISGEQAQVNGWKSSQSRTSYNLIPSDVWDDDTNYTYADAYISWDGTSGTVSAPGVTSSNIPQYPASNTVEVQIP